MTTITPERSPAAANAPCLAASPLAGPIITVLFVASVLAFLLGLAALGPII